MRLRRLADGFMIGGVTLGVLAALGYAADIVPNLPPAILKLVIYKLTFVGGVGLLVVGAFLRRVASRGTSTGSDVSLTTRSTSVPEAESPPALGEPADLNGQWLRESRPTPQPRERRER